MRRLFYYPGNKWGNRPPEIRKFHCLWVNTPPSPPGQVGQRRTKSYWAGQNTNRTTVGHDLGTPKVGPLRGRLKRVFTKSRRLRRHRTERGPVGTCSHCGGPAKVIADTSDRCIEDQQLIDKILSHLKKKDRLQSLPNALPETRAPPHQQ